MSAPKAGAPGVCGALADLHGQAKDARQPQPPFAGRGIAIPAFASQFRWRISSTFSRARRSRASGGSWLGFGGTAAGWLIRLIEPQQLATGRGREYGALRCFAADFLMWPGNRGRCGAPAVLLYWPLPQRADTPGVISRRNSRGRRPAVALGQTQNTPPPAISFFTRLM